MKPIPECVGQAEMERGRSPLASVPPFGCPGHAALVVESFVDIGKTFTKPSRNLVHETSTMDFHETCLTQDQAGERPILKHKRRRSTGFTDKNSSRAS